MSLVHRVIKNPVKNLRWSFKPLTIFAKLSILDVWQGSGFKHKGENIIYRKNKFSLWFKSFIDVGLYHIETSPLICRANEWTGFYMIGTSVMKELITLTIESNNKNIKTIFED